LPPLLLSASVFPWFEDSALSGYHGSIIFRERLAKRATNQLSFRDLLPSLIDAHRRWLQHWFYFALRVRTSITTDRIGGPFDAFLHFFLGQTGSFPQRSWTWPGLTGASIGTIPSLSSSLFQVSIFPFQFGHLTRWFSGPSSTFRHLLILFDLLISPLLCGTDDLARLSCRKVSIAPQKVALGCLLPQDFYDMNRAVLWKSLWLRSKLRINQIKVDDIKARKRIDLCACSMSRILLYSYIANC
jgi:hypothetical protein